MTGVLRHQEDDAFVRCYLCQADAAGPCARCRKSVCGNCCVLVDGAAQKWAICTRCEHRGGREVGGWKGLSLFFGKIILGLILLVVVLYFLTRLR